MGDNTVQLFNDSFERCIKDPEFLDRFYALFISSSDEVRQKFKNTNMDGQKEMLLRSLPFMMAAYRKPDTLSKIAIRHNANNLNIGSNLYSLWLDCLIEAVKLTDACFTADIEKSWRTLMQHGIDYMVSKYSED